MGHPLMTSSTELLHERIDEDIGESSERRNGCSSTVDRYHSTRRQRSMGIVDLNHTAQLPNGEDIITTRGFRRAVRDTPTASVLNVLTCGLLTLLCRLFGHVSLLFCKKSSLALADIVYIKDSHGHHHIRRVITLKNKEGIAVPTSDCKYSIVHKLRTFSFRKNKYLWSEETKSFDVLSELSTKTTVDRLLHMALSSSGGLSHEQVRTRRALYGLNEIRVKVRSALTLLFREVLNLFNIFQMLSCSLWIYDDYYYYAGAIITISLVTMTRSVQEIKNQERKMVKMTHNVTEVTVKRENVIVSIKSPDLVPGDIVVLPPGNFECPCDLLLLGGSCVVTEAMLTGESVPVTKIALTNDGNTQLFLLDKHEKNILFCGTTALQCRAESGQDHAIAMVLRTGYSTMKGQLVRSIMYPRPLDKHLERESLKVFGYLGIVAGIGMVYALYMQYQGGAEPKSLVVRTLDVVTIVVPPALPLVINTCLSYAAQHLKKKRIFCTSPSIITTAGEVNVVCFDKTGTLTDDKLHFHCARMATTRDEKLQLSDSITSCLDIEDTPLVRALASCHTVASIDGKLAGDPMDVLLFTWTGWTMEEVDGKDEEVKMTVVSPTKRCPSLPIDETISYCGKNEVEKESVVEETRERLVCRVQFPFSSELQRMGVVMEDDDGITFYAKGSPEKIRSLCDETTVPAQFMEVVEEYSRKGLRIIAIAEKSMTRNVYDDMTRDQLEDNMTFLSLLIFDNKVKEVTVEVIEQLKRADIRVVMLTGDNILTAASVGEQTGILMKEKRTLVVSHEDFETTVVMPKLKILPIEIGGYKMNGVCHEEIIPDVLPSLHYQLVISGTTFDVVRKYYPHLMDELILSGAVFARMSPDQKLAVIHELQRLEYIPAMVGDGANDCAALKAAHVGISLSEAEASIAAPLTAGCGDISCVVDILAEGRAAMCTYFCSFIYMCLYSLSQFFGVSVCYWLPSRFTQIQFLYLDLPIGLPIAVFFGTTEARPQLTRERPNVSIFSLHTLVSFTHIMLNICISFLITFHYTRNQSWYTGFERLAGNDATPAVEVTCLFFVGAFVTCGLALVLSQSVRGLPFRERIYKNFNLTLTLIINACVLLVLLFVPWKKAEELFEFVLPPNGWPRAIVLIIALISITVAFLLQKLLVDKLPARQRVAHIRRLGSGEEDSNTKAYETVHMKCLRTPELAMEKNGDTNTQK